ncbi:hypothetical protein BDK51DRAFT_25050, partial [Blyttiomyces helicus]
NVATVIVKRGTLRTGDVLVAGNVYCKVRQLLNEASVLVREAGPSVPVEVTGWKEVPAAGDQVLGAENEELAKRVCESRIELAKIAGTVKFIDDLNEKRKNSKLQREAQAAEGGAAPAPVKNKEKVLHLVVRADVQGSLEAVLNEIYGLPSHEVRVNVVNGAIGTVSESAVQLAVATKAKVIAFNTPIDRRAQESAVASRVQIQEHKIIYALVDGIKDLMSDLLPPEIVTEVHGEAEVLQTFNINVKGKVTETIAGCKIASGIIKRSSKLRVMRGNDIIVQHASLKTFRHHKSDINEASKGLECGMALDRSFDFLPGDIIQSFSTSEKKRTISA